jgi:hypothetical protein
MRHGRSRMRDGAQSGAPAIVGATHWVALDPPRHAETGRGNASPLRITRGRCVGAGFKPAPTGQRPPRTTGGGTKWRLARWIRAVAALQPATRERSSTGEQGAKREIGERDLDPHASSQRLAARARRARRRAHRCEALFRRAAPSPDQGAIERVLHRLGSRQPLRMRRSLHSVSVRRIKFALLSFDLESFSRMQREIPYMSTESNLHYVADPPQPLTRAAS